MTSTKHNRIGNRYILHEKLGQGGMAEVYRATHALLEREVAIKFVNPNALGDPTLIQRFQHEAKWIGQLRHPNIMHVYDLDLTDDGQFFMAMEYLPEGDLETQIRTRRQQNQPFTLNEAVYIIKAVADGLGHAHANGIIHRDVKSSNIFIADGSRVVIGDFGLAKRVQDSSDGLRQTAAGVVMGTPHYIAPEQAEGREVDARTDVYSLGVVLFEVLTGQLPYDSNSAVALLIQHLQAPIPNPCELRPDLPPAATTIIQRVLAKDPAERYPSMAAFSEALDSLVPVGANPTPTLLNLNPISRTVVMPSPSAPPLHVSAPLARPSLLRPTTQVNLNLTLSWVSIVLAVLAIAVLIGAVAHITTFNGEDTTREATAPVTAEIGLAPAATDEILLLVAPMQDTASGVNIAEEIGTWLSTGPLKAILEGQLRVAYLSTAVTSSTEASRLGTELGAKAVIWGRMDATGWQVAVQVPDQASNTLRLQVPIAPTQGSVLGEQVPILADVYCRVLLMDDLMAADNFYAAIFLLLRLGDIADFETYVELGATHYDQQVVAGLTSLMSNDFLAADTAISESLAISPNNPALLYFRWAINVLSGNDELALRDIERLETATGNASFAKGLRVLSYYLSGNTEAILENRIEMGSVSVSSELLIHGLVFQAQMQAGRYAEALADLNAYRAWLAERNYANWEGVYIDSLGFIYLVQGDAAALNRVLPDLKDFRASRTYQDAHAFVRQVRPDGYAPITFAFGGFVEAATGQLANARLTYRLGLALHPDDTLLNWQQAGEDTQAANYQSAYDRYEAAVANAPAPFPIARYDQALLVREHGADLSDPRAVCDLLAEAQTLAASDATFYEVLISQISATASAEGCN